MTKAAHARWVALAPERWSGFVLYAQAEELEGVDTEGGAKLIGCDNFQLPLAPGREAWLEVSILVNGTTGSADILIGNVLPHDEWNGSLDLGKDIVRLRSPPDGKGRIKIPIEWKLWDTGEVATAK